MAEQARLEKLANPIPIARPVPGQPIFNLALQMPTAAAELRKAAAPAEKPLKPKRERYMDRCDPVLRFKVGERLECRMEAEGYEKSWFRAELLQFRDDGLIRVSFYELP